MGFLRKGITAKAFSSAARKRNGGDCTASMCDNCLCGGPARLNYVVQLRVASFFAFDFIVEFRRANLSTPTDAFMTLVWLHDLV